MSGALYLGAVMTGYRHNGQQPNQLLFLGCVIIQIRVHILETT